MRGWLVAGAVAVVAIGEAGLGRDEPLIVLAVDALAGAAFLAAGIVACGRPAARRFGTAAYTSGVVWFLANLVGVADVAHRPLLVYAVLSFPTGRLNASWPRAVVASALGVALLPEPLSRMGSVAVAAALIATAAGAVTIRSARPGAGATVARASLALGVAIGGAALVGLFEPVTAVADVVTLAYAALVAVAGATLLWTLLFGGGRRFQLADNVVELTELAAGDVDAMVASVTRHRLAADDAEADVLAAVAQMVQENRSLHAALEVQVDEVRRSGRRLMVADDLERHRLARHLASGPSRDLDDVQTAVAAISELPDHDRDLVDRLVDEIAGARDDLEQLGRGLHPRLLVEGGLRSSLEDLARRTQVPTTVRAPDTRFSTTVETTLWYFCAEAAANVAKHARASSMSIEIELAGDHLVATVADDGAGGARPSEGSGLTGLVDRLRAVDGHLELTTAPGGGTRLRAWVPVS